MFCLGGVVVDLCRWINMCVCLWRPVSVCVLCGEECVSVICLCIFVYGIVHVNGIFHVCVCVLGCMCVCIVVYSPLRLQTYIFKAF